MNKFFTIPPFGSACANRRAWKVGLLALLALAAASPAAPVPPDPLLPLNFANPLVTASTNRDLGDAVAGQPLTRQINAVGGFTPRAFSTNAVLAGTPGAPGLQLTRSGILKQFGPTTSATTPAGPFTFDVKVSDGFGPVANTKTETFSVNFVTDTTFRFAHNALSDGAVGCSYSEFVPLINGKGPFNFTISNIAVDGNPLLVNGVPQQNLEAVGLFLSSDGVLFGVPRTAGKYTFTITAVDVGNSIAILPAAGRNGTGSSQDFTLKVLANTVFGSTAVPTMVTVRSDFGKDKHGVGRDGLTYKGVVNLNGASVSSLAGTPFRLRIGNYYSPTVTFDGNGKATTARKVIPSMLVTVKKNGELTVTVAHDVIDPGVGGLPNTDLAVEIRGDQFLNTSFLRVFVKPAANGSTGTYKLASGGNLGGSAQLFSVQGADDKAATGDAWKVSFVCQLPSAVAPSLSIVNAVEVKIGTGFDQVTTLLNRNGKFSGKGDRKSPVVTAFSFDTKTGKGSFITGVLPSAIGMGMAPAQTTGIPTALLAAPTNVFPVEINLKCGSLSCAEIQGSLAIFPKGKRWVSLNPVK